MSLTRYRQKRKFRRTPEPRGAAPRRRQRRQSGLSFVVQKHDASHLHYDFRLELGGVLKSWAVPKGPSLDPTIKRLAVEVEDHPLEYGSFEGTIPQREYGGGTVLLWDRGRWQPQDDPEAGLREGKLKFELEGEKLRGAWMLVRRHGPQAAKPQWLLFKVHDEQARNEAEFIVTEALPVSVASGRDLDEIAAGKKGRRNRHQVHSPPASLPKAARREKTAAPGEKRCDRVGKRSLPRNISPQLPTLVDAAPSGDEWSHEIKFDGYRMLCHLDGAEARFETRRHQDWTAKLPELAKAAARLKLRQTIVDGEVVAFDEHGISQFQILQNAFRERQNQKLVYTVFDLLFLDGEDLRDLPLEERKARLKDLGLPADRGPIRYTDHMVGHGPEFFREAERHGLEGIVSKRRDRPYRSGRGLDWVKVKAHQRAEFVVGGYSEPAGSRHGFGALLVGYHDADGKLQYAGRVGTGFSDATLNDLQKRLKSLEQSRSPFAASPSLSARSKGVHWVRPRLVAELAFSNWTDDNLLRQPSFQGLREDKPAESVTRETPQVLPDGDGNAQNNGRQHRSTDARRKAGAKPRTHGQRGDAAPRHARPHEGATETTLAGVRLTHPDKLLFSDPEITKHDLAQYYLDLADEILPHVADRPLAIIRCPDGAAGQCFFQKTLGKGAPQELTRCLHEKKGKDAYLTICGADGLVALAQIGALEVHTWGCRLDAIERPDRLVFDLDPAPNVAWRRVIDAALALREFLEQLGLQSFLKTSGGKGLHLVVPMARKHDWPATAHFCRLVAEVAERAAPDRFVATMSKQKRTGKIFVDWLRNQRGATTIAPFCPRARPGAPVSLPVSWDELPRTSSGDQFHLAEIRQRLRALKRNPWAGLAKRRQGITAAMVKRLEAANAPELFHPR